MDTSRDFFEIFIRYFSIYLFIYINKLKKQLLNYCFKNCSVLLFSLSSFFNRSISASFCSMTARLSARPCSKPFYKPASKLSSRIDFLYSSSSNSNILIDITSALFANRKSFNVISDSFNRFFNNSL